MSEIVFVGLGLNDELGISLRGIEEIKSAFTVFMESYTSLMPDFSMQRFRKICGIEPQIVARNQLEDENGKQVLRAAALGKAVLLVPGDPLVATTHLALRIEAEKRGIKTRVVHGASILTAAIGLSGLQHYKFGKCVTIPFPEKSLSETPYTVIGQNRQLGLHTLCLLDIETERKRYMSIREGLDLLLEVERRRERKVVTPDTLSVGVARAGSNNPLVKADFVRDLISHDFGKPPHSILFPGKLHFMEAEALVVLANAPETIKEMSE